MTNLVRLSPLRWPYSLEQLRVDEPSRSFSPSPSAAELAYFQVFPVHPWPQPPFDPATHRVVEVQPANVDGRWLQQWQLVELTAEEAQAHYWATHPARWLEFSAALPPQVDDVLRAVSAVSPRLELAMGVGLGKAADGDPRVFLQAWQTARSLGLVPAELAQGLQALAVQHDLPPDFVAGLSMEAEP
jgi:hypothetical protein